VLSGAASVKDWVNPSGGVQSEGGMVRSMERKKRKRDRREFPTKEWAGELSGRNRKRESKCSPG